MIKFIKNLFKSKYTPYSFVEVITKSEEIMLNNPDGVSDPLDVAIIHTGEFVDVQYEKWVAHHLHTGLPKYKLIRI